MTDYVIRHPLLSGDYIVRSCTLTEARSIGVDVVAGTLRTLGLIAPGSSDEAVAGDVTVDAADAA